MVEKFSPSQFSTAASCIRKWWFDKVVKLPIKSKDYFTFGNVLHAVVERWLLADDTGRDKDGNEVDLYPDGWEACYNRWTGEPSGVVNPAEANLIKTLVTKAIEQGILVRHYPRQIELPIDGEIVEGAELTGYIDVLHGTTVEDHKTCKTFKYSLTPKGLSEDLKMNIYAWWFLNELRKNGVPDQPITLIHNYFSKDPNNPKIKQVKVDIDPGDLDESWEIIQELSSNMLEVINAKVPIKDWEEVPKTKTPEVDCNAYGGCDFKSICYRTGTVDSYQKSVERFNLIKEKEMSDIFSNLRKKHQASVSPAEPEPVEEVQEPEPETEETEEVETSEVPPWGDRVSCIACKGAGFNTKGVPCRICVSKWEGPIDKFAFDTSDGEVFWVGPGSEGSCPIPTKGKKTAPRVIKQEETTDPVETEQPPETQTTNTTTVVKNKRGRPPRTFSLLIGVTTSKDGPNTERLESIISRLQPDNYYDLDPFKRRDALCVAVPEEIAKKKITTVIVTSRSPDIDAVLATLTPHADAIYYSVGR